jgi:hypothetical protein
MEDVVSEDRGGDGVLENGARMGEGYEIEVEVGVRSWGRCVLSRDETEAMQTRNPEARRGLPR